MQYEEALREWGFIQIRESYEAPSPYGLTITGTADDISVQTNFDEGFACCGGANPDCYCSFATSPRAEVIVHYGGTYEGSPEYYPPRLMYSIPLEDFDFAKFLGEVVAAGKGKLVA